MKTILTMAAVGFAFVLASGSAKAQPFLVPHTTTHYHAVPHRGHVDLVPHTTTHFHRVNPYGWNGPRYYGGSAFVPHTRTHLDVIPHRGHYHVVPHTTTHFHRVPGHYHR